MVHHASLLSYEQALAVIVEHTPQGKRERLSLDQVHQRVAAADISAEIPVPSYDQSHRDGYALGCAELPSGASHASYDLAGEIITGRPSAVTVGTTQAYRIMTGGMVPEGTQRVVQQEDCVVSDGCLRVPVRALTAEQRFIQKTGSAIQQGTVILPAGTMIGASQVSLLAETGNHQLVVYKKVAVSSFCTGNELIEPEDNRLSAKKISSNRYLLKALIEGYHAESIDYGTIPDDPDLIAGCFERGATGEADIIISTGGTGQGTYDLLEPAFKRQGGLVHFQALAIRPGRSMLFGEIAGKLYFGLPGPPSAVRVLFQELVRPAIRKLQGRIALPLMGEALLVEEQLSGQKNSTRIIEGILFARGHTRLVRLPEGHETPNCHIILAATDEDRVRGDAVSVHSLQDEWC